VKYVKCKISKFRKQRYVTYVVCTKMRAYRPRPALIRINYVYVYISASYRLKVLQVKYNGRSYSWHNDIRPL